MAYKHVVISNIGKKNRAVRELTTGLTFSSTSKAAVHFDISKETIAVYANGRSKRPQLTYKFEWVMNKEN